MPLELDGITAGIHCGDVELECYNVEKSHDGKTMTCWVASEAGKTFTVVYSMPSKHEMDPAISDVYVDGFKAGGINMHARSKTCNGLKTYTCKGCYSSTTTIRPYTFAKIRVTDDDSFEQHSASDIGNVALKIFTALISGDARPVNYQFVDGKFREQTVHERAKNMCSHRIELGSEVKVAEPLKAYLYRPLDVLKAHGIVPRKPQPRPSPVPKTGAAPPVRTISPEAPLGLFDVKREDLNVNFDVEKAALATEIPAAYVNSPETPGPSSVKREATDGKESKDAALATEIPAARIKFPAISAPHKVKREDRANAEEVALAAEIQALEEKLRKLRKKERKMALLKELAELESDGDSSPSTSQRPAKRVKRESSVIDLTSP